MKKAALVQALAEMAAEITSVANVYYATHPDMHPVERDSRVAYRREAAAVLIAAINHINGVSPTQE